MIDRALVSLRPNAKWTLMGDELSSLVWHDDPSNRPTDAEINAKVVELEAAEPLLKRAMEIKEGQFDPGHPSLVTGLKNYASLLRALGREEEAEVFERKATVLPPKRTGRAPE